MRSRKSDVIAVRVSKETKELFRRLLHVFLSNNPDATAESFILYLLNSYSDESVRQCVMQCIESRKRILMY